MALKVYYDNDTNMCHVGGDDYRPDNVRLSGSDDSVILEFGKTRLIDKLPVSQIVDKSGVPYVNYSTFRAAIKDFFVNAPVWDAGAILYGVERLRNSPDPDFVPIGNLFQHMTLPIHNKRKLVKVNFARQVVGVLKQTDITKMEDGSVALLDGTDGADVGVQNPYMWAILDGGGSTGKFERWIIGDRPFTYDGDVAIEIKSYVDAADNCTLETPTNRLRCVRNETAAFAGSGAGATAGGLGYARTAISRYNMEVYAGNRGLKNYGTYYRDHLVEAALMYIEFKTKNLKAVFGSCGTGFTTQQWTDYNSQNPVLKILEAHLTLSGRADIVSQGHLTGTYTKAFTFTSGAPVTLNVDFGCYRGKVLRNGIWNHMSGIEYEIQSIADGALSKVYVQFNPDLLDANRVDTSFAFRDTYTYLGLAPRADGWSKGANKKSKQAAAIGGGETTYDCQYFITNIPAAGTSRWCVLEGGYLSLGGVVAFGSSHTSYAPSLASSIVGVGFRADVVE